MSNSADTKNAALVSPSDSRSFSIAVGISGLSSAILFVVVSLIVAFGVGPDPTELIAWLERFPDIFPFRVAENGLYLIVLMLWLGMFLSLGEIARESHPVLGKLGSGFALAGVSILIAGSLPHIGTFPISNIYEDLELAGAITSGTVDPRLNIASLTYMWQSQWGVFDALLFAGIAPLGVGIFFIGISAYSAIGRGYGSLLIATGVLSLAGSAGAIIDPQGLFVAASILSIVLLSFISGIRFLRRGARANP
jgi:hypothetical protein